jgi:hypothetical protein
MRQGLTADIKVRIEPMDKLALEQFARLDDLDVSDIARRAFKDYIRGRTRSELTLLTQTESPHVRS